MGGQWEVSGKPEASKWAFADCLPGGGVVIIKLLPLKKREMRLLARRLANNSWAEVAAILHRSPAPNTFTVRPLKQPRVTLKPISSGAQARWSTFRLLRLSTTPPLRSHGEPVPSHDAPCDPATLQPRYPATPLRSHGEPVPSHGEPVPDRDEPCYPATPATLPP